jgi:hypothetical protein
MASLSSDVKPGEFTHFRASREPAGFFDLFEGEEDAEAGRHQQDCGVIT